jgi:hypothetical protein
MAGTLAEIGVFEARNSAITIRGYRNLWRGGSGISIGDFSAPSAAVKLLNAVLASSVAEAGRA